MYSQASGSAILLNKSSPSLQSTLARQIDYEESTSVRNVIRVWGRFLEMKQSKSTQVVQKPSNLGTYSECHSFLTA